MADAGSKHEKALSAAKSKAVVHPVGSKKQPGSGKARSSPGHHVKPLSQRHPPPPRAGGASEGQCWTWYHIWIPLIAVLLLLAALGPSVLVLMMTTRVDNLPIWYYAFLGLVLPATLLLALLAGSPFLHRCTGMTGSAQVKFILLLAACCTVLEVVLAVVGVMLFLNSHEMAEYWKRVESVQGEFMRVQYASIGFVAVVFVLLLFLWVQIFFLRRETPRAAGKPAVGTSPKGSPKGSPRGSPKGSPKSSPKGSPKGIPKASPKTSPKSGHKAK